MKRIENLFYAMLLAYPAGMLIGALVKGLGL